MLLALSACSTTAKLAEGDVLYTGVKKLDVTAADSVKIPSGISDNIGEIIDVPANNSMVFALCAFAVPAWAVALQSLAGGLQGA